MAEYTKYKAGDKVKVRRDLNQDTEYYMLNEDGSRNLEEHNSFIDDMKEFCKRNGYVVIIDGMSYSGQYKVKEFGYSWTDEMFEGLVEDEYDTTKFEAFLREVDDENGDYDVWKNMSYLVCGKFKTSDEKEKAISELVAFYKAYNPVKKHTMKELKEILGYDFELVED